jgi:hypothetical protein
MPLKIVRISPGKYSVVNIETGRVHSYATSLKKAKAQVRLIQARDGESIENSLLRKIQRRANKLRIPYENIQLSPLKNKKIRIKINGKILDFGAKNSFTFLEGASEAKRKAYQERHSKIFLKNGRRAIDVVYSPAWLSWHLLWT